MLKQFAALLKMFKRST